MILKIVNTWEWTRVVFKELYYAANNQKIANKKEADYEEALEKRRADSTARSHDSYMKDREVTKVIWRIWKSHVDSAAWSHESYMKDRENSNADIAALSDEIY